MKNSLHLHLALAQEVEKYVCTAEFGPQGLLLLLIVDYFNSLLFNRTLPFVLVLFIVMFIELLQVYTSGSERIVPCFVTVIRNPDWDVKHSTMLF